ncbi:hypothetical protein SPBR_03337 [Sporothrix brasiliensis 5110]|uniref:Uncharacterized protein n=1 Tax=Sporothrix brasiliensis 5110 TaxID=1398154 RepID=A0A0C2J5W1_9PEZI|nr:uncharacterized protein SPBR_03337 [Sporothrix brasiliensis 5110]KIH92437.1 hypothetical protein SPBR_03337 [Sporothrix brasiliensis 5110]
MVAPSRITPTGGISFAQHPMEGKKGVRFEHCFKLRITFPAHVKADMVTAKATLYNADAAITPYADADPAPRLIAPERTSSRLLRMGVDGSRQFELEFWSLAINRAGRFCVRFDVDYYYKLNPRRAYGVRYSYNINIADFSF